MTLFARPGLSLSPVRPTRRAEGLARADVPVLIGYATRGPAMVPVRIESLRQFQAVYGAPLPGTHLQDAVKGFFETGGRAAYVLRLVGPGARVATADLGPWQARAHLPLGALGALDQVDTALPWFEALRRQGLSLPDPGAWANALSVTVTEVARQRGVAEGAGSVLFPQTMPGLTAFGILRLSAAGNEAIVQIAHVDTVRGRVELTAPLPFAGPYDFQTVTFDVEIRAQGQRIESFADLHLVPDHPGSITARLNRQSQSLRLDFLGPEDADFRDKTRWPKPGTSLLTGGSANLSGLTEGDWQAAVTAQSRIDEIALVALPDLVRQPPQVRRDLTPSAPKPLRCDLPDAQPRAALAGIVRDSATLAAVPLCRVEAAGEGRITQTDAAGFFYLDGLSLGMIDLRLRAEGYEEVETFLQSSTAARKFAPPLLHGAADPDLADLRLVALDDIRSFDPDAVAAIQRSAVDLMGDYRVAVLDPPAPDLSPEALLRWRAALGQNARCFATAPWLTVSPEAGGALANQPPSGHVCGAFARAEITQGVHRAPANLALRHVWGLSADLDEPTLAAFHAASLNALRALPGQGLRLMGSRSLSADPEWQQISVRRLFDAVEKTLTARLAWSVFEPNSTTTRAILGFSVGQFLETLRKRGMFAGISAAEAYGVTCDGTNNTPDSAARGELTVDIQIAPTKPYEFIRISLTAQADAIEVTEAT